MMKIPIKKPMASEAALFEQLVAMVQLAKKVGQGCHSLRSLPRNNEASLPVVESSLSAPQSQATFLEELIDACVLELYFPEEAAAKDLLFMDQVAELLNVDDASSFVISAPSAPCSSATKLEASSTIERIETFVATANAPSHPIRNQLIRLTADSPDLFAVIKQEGKV